MPEPSQRSSHLRQMTRVDSSDGPTSDGNLESPYHEDKRTTSVPTKSGTDVALRPRSRSDSLHATSRPSSRASDKTDDIDHADAEIIHNLTATPSAVELNITTRMITKPAVELDFEPMNLHQVYRMAAAKTVPRKAQPDQPAQSSQPSQSSQPVSVASLEKSNQEHQTSARNIRDEYPVVSVTQAPADFREDVQSQLPQMFQNMPNPQSQRATSRTRAPSKSRHHSDRSSLHGQKQFRRRSPAPQSPVVNVWSTDMQTLDGPILKSTVPITNPTSTTQPPLKRNNVVEETNNAGALSVAASDTDIIFCVTSDAPGNPTGVLTAAKSPLIEQHNSNMEKEANVQSEASGIDPIDVPMQDFTADDMPRTDDENLDLEARSVVHAESPEVRIADLQDEHHVVNQHPLEDDHAGVDEHLTEDQNSAQESHPVEKLQTIPPNLQTDATHGTTNEVQGVQHLPTPPDTMQLVRMDKQQPLHEVADRSGSTRVTKKKPKPSSSGPTARKMTLKSRLGSLPYTAAQLYQLADYIEEKERMEEKQGWVRDLAAKQAELEQANQHNLSLQNECAELKTSLEKHSGYREKLKSFMLAFDGLGHDMKALQKAKAKYDREFARLKSQLDTNLDAATKVSDQGLEKIGNLRAKSLALLKECQSFIDTLKKEKSGLERRLDKTYRTLAEEKDRLAAFDRRLQDLQKEKNSGEDMLNGRTSKLSAQLSEFKALIEQSASTSATFTSEHLESMKKEYATLSEQVHSSATNSETIKTSIDQLSSGFQKHIEDIKTANTEATNAHAEAHTKAENKIVALLEEIKSGFKDRKDLAEKNAVLRENISQEKYKLESSTENINKLKADMKEKNNDEALLKQRIEELQTSQTILQAEKASAEKDKTTISKLTTSEGNLKQEIQKLKSEKTESMAAITSIDEQKKTLQREKAELQDQVKETTKRLEQVRSAVPDFSEERTRMEAKVKQQIEATIAESHVQARKLAVNFGNQKLRQEKKKEEVDLALVAKENTVRDLQSQLERLKQGLGNRSLTSWSDEMEHKDAEIKRLDNEGTAARGQVEDLQRQLEEALKSIQSVRSSAQEKLEERDTHIKLLGSSNTETKDVVESLQQELKEANRSREASEKAHQEDETRKSQEANDQLKAMEARLSEAGSAKRAIDIKLVDLEKRTSNEAEHRQKEVEDLRRNLEDANTRLKDTEERLNQQQVVISQKDLDIEKLKQDNAKAAPFEVPNSQEEIESQMSTSPAKRTRRAVNRTLRSISKPSSPATSAEAMQSDVPESTQPRGTGSSIFGPYHEPRATGNPEIGLNNLRPDGDDEMLFANPKSRPGTSQSDIQNALDLGTQELLDAEGVRSRAQIRANFESQSQKSSSSISEVNKLGESFKEAAQIEAQASQSQNRTNASQQQSLGMSALKLNTQEAQDSLDLSAQEQQQSLDLSAQDRQQSLDLSAQDDLIESSQPGFETPGKTGGRNLQGVGRKLTPRPKSQPRSQSNAEILPSTSTGRLAKGAMVASQQKKVSALSSGPHNFKPGGGGKGKGKRVSYADEDDDDEYSVLSSSGRGSSSPAKRPAAQSTKSNKRVRTEASTSTLSSSQRSATATPRRSQTTAKSSSQNKAPPSAQGAGTPDPPRRRSGRTNKEQNMVSRFNDEIGSPRTARRG